MGKIKFTDDEIALIEAIRNYKKSLHNPKMHFFLFKKKKYLNI